MNRAERIKILRVAKGWTQPDLVRALREHGAPFKTTSYLSKLENGAAQRAPANVLDAIAAGLEVPNGAILTAEHDSSIDKDPVRFVSLQSLETFIVKDQVPEAHAAVLRRVCDQVDAPRDVRAWRTAYSFLAAFDDVQSSTPIGERQDP